MEEQNKRIVQSGKYSFSNKSTTDDEENTS